jgi:hypothetical protein
VSEELVLDEEQGGRRGRTHKLGEGESAVRADDGKRIEMDAKGDARYREMDESERRKA